MDIDPEEYGWKLQRNGYWKHKDSKLCLLQMEGDTISVDMITDNGIIIITEIFPKEFSALMTVLHIKKIKNDSTTLH